MRLEPKNLINEYIRNNKPNFLKEDAVYMSMHDEYLLDDDAKAAQELQGMATELNGYTHGSLIQARTTKMIADEITLFDEDGNQYTFDHPLKGFITQLDGVMYFIYNHNLYLNLLKSNHPELWKQFYNKHNKEFMKNLLGTSIETLVNVNHCEAKETYYNVDFYINELKQENLAIFNEILGEESLNKLLCIDQESVIESTNKLTAEIDSALSATTNDKKCN